MTGIPKGKADALVVFCVYATSNGKTYYLDDGETKTSVVGISYNDIIER